MMGGECASSVYFNPTFLTSFRILGHSVILFLPFGGDKLAFIDSDVYFVKTLLNLFANVNWKQQKTSTHRD